MVQPSDAAEDDGQLRLQTRALLETLGDLDISLVDLVVAACECSDDAVEIDDLVDGLVDSGRIRIRRRDADPMLAQSF